MFIQDVEMNFVTVSVETANAGLRSICQIGIARYEEGQLVEEWGTFINPECEFDPLNTLAHGISVQDVEFAPKLPEIEFKLRAMLEGEICICHTIFDRKSIARALKYYKLRYLDTLWIDSSRVARRAWEDCRYGGFGLIQLCEKLGYKVELHDSLEKAKASGNIMLAASKESNVSIEEWTVKQLEPIKDLLPREEFDANVDGDLFGEFVVFTGRFFIGTEGAERMASYLGCTIRKSVSRKTTILIVGNQYLSMLRGNPKSVNYRKAESLINEGVPIRLIKEMDIDFLLDYQY